MNKKVAIVVLAIIVVAGIWAFSDDSSSKKDEKETVSLQSYAEFGGVDVTLDDNYVYTPSGSSFFSNFDSNMKTQCPICDGTGKKQCTGCGGLGKTYQTKNSVDFGYGSSSYQVSSKCYQCGGSGLTPCTYCINGYIN